MTFRRRFLAVVAVAAAAPLGIVADVRAADVPAHTIAPGDTDPAITDTASPTPGTRGANLVWLAPAQRRVGKLLVFLPYGGLDQRTTEYEEVGSEAGRLGYHTIVLAYRNDVPIANPAACGILEAPPLLPENCAGNARQEILSGAPVSPVVAVSQANSIENRLNKMLVYLRTNFPAEGWSKFLDANDKPVWSETVIAGGSLGAGMAVLIAQQHLVHRVSLFAGWTDARHGWVKRVATPAEKYFSLIHVRDTFYERTCWAYKDLGLRETCPMPNPPSLIENNEPPFDTRQLIFNLEPQPGEVVAGNIFHASTARDGPIRKESDGVTPVRALVNGWRSILGDQDADTWLDERDNCPIVPNPEQIDSDQNGIGDACGPTIVAGTVGGSVPATLSLTLGTPAAFGAFTPGVDRSYDASMTATVISSAGDAALSVHDAGTNAPGRLVNGTFSLSEPLQASATGTFAALSVSPLTLLTYTGPVSNGSAALAFRQHIGPTQALRTGAYSKTLTFTLSTTMP